MWSEDNWAFNTVHIVNQADWTSFFLMQNIEFEEKFSVFIYFNKMNENHYIIAS